MQRILLAVSGLALFILFLICFASYACLQKINPTVFTTNYVNDQQQNIWVEGKTRNLAIEVTGTIDTAFLNPATITSPIDGLIVGATPLIQLTSVPEAKYCRVLLGNNSSNEPAYRFWHRQFRTQHNACLLPLGDLRPGSNYMIPNLVPGLRIWIYARAVLPYLCRLLPQQEEVGLKNSSHISSS